MYYGLIICWDGGIPIITIENNWSMIIMSVSPIIIQFQYHFGQGSQYKVVLGLWYNLSV